MIQWPKMMCELYSMSYIFLSFFRRHHPQHATEIVQDLHGKVRRQHTVQHHCVRHLSTSTPVRGTLPKSCKSPPFFLRLLSFNKLALICLQHFFTCFVYVLGKLRQDSHWRTNRTDSSNEISRQEDNCNE